MITELLHPLRSYARQILKTLVCLAGGTAAITALSAPAPVPFRTITPDVASVQLRSNFDETTAGQVREVDVPDAKWLQLRFVEYNLGESGRLVIRAIDSRETQTFTQASLETWGGATAIFDSTRLRVELQLGGNQTEDLFFKIGQVLVGEAEHASDRSASMHREQDAPSEELCGRDNRIATNDRRVGRIMPIGCTAWIIGTNTFLTAGHCVDATMQILQFNVPASGSGGTPNNPGVADQYAIVQDSVVFHDDSGDDWALFRVAPNSNTNLLPRQAQGAQFELSNTEKPARVRVTGFGTDVGTANQTLQTHAGKFLGVDVDDPSDVTMEYTVDTQPGNSGSPVIAVHGNGAAVGIHTHGGCSPPDEGNKGTSFRNELLWQTIDQYLGLRVGAFDSGWTDARFLAPSGRCAYVVRGDDLYCMVKDGGRLRVGASDSGWTDARFLAASDECGYVIRGDDLYCMIKGGGRLRVGASDSGWTDARFLAASDECAYVIRGDDLYCMIKDGGRFRVGASDSGWTGARFLAASDECAYVIRGDDLYCMVKDGGRLRVGASDSGWADARFLAASDECAYVIRGDDLYCMVKDGGRFRVGASDSGWTDARFLAASDECAYVIRGDDLYCMTKDGGRLRVDASDSGWTDARFLAASDRCVYLIRGDDLYCVVK